MTVDIDGTDRAALIPGGYTAIDVLADPEAREAARQAAESVNPSSPALSDLELAAPVRPGKMLCLGYNYRGHVPDGRDPRSEDPDFPDVFVKTPNTLGGPADPVVLPSAAVDVDYEGEIALVIGRTARSVPEEHALSHVAGLTLLNDVSDRSWQRRQSQWTMGKCFDGFAPLGPWIVTSDDIDDPQDLVVEVVRDGRVTVSQSTATTIFSAAFIVHHLSTVMTLEPGDIISTGTPQKLPEAQTAHRPLVPGDAITIRVAGIGELTTTFVAAPETPEVPA
ncbi:2-keto-4-pentenoate hydratase/2-oxohepta-3-ene-1,7-dioic acid hydratase in catechol pathway [Microbacterium foliorum]|uniref:fumarylacetoacetate hydrolase family protein n=1 Tax=Microbacterium foliorum TaxID=104336 RepID=UPI00209CE4F2|nr:fumarylacetoacetate hydrolase family protein [Microbacterium foliorum]MCP1428158.1 2-keto-4-pentenoate hydratase/2-oxohepta-3-ene-1,7-dioic acid hydratase in catechol pathway [Microbacterium foliorum]